jgi:plasmid maintenance system antidote protein VapI
MSRTKAKVEDLAVKKGDRFWAMGADVEVLRASSTWADIKVRQPKGAQWTKRQPLPFPADWERQEPNLKMHEFDPMWTIHPGVTWRELVDESELSQAAIAREMGISQKHLSQILTCTAMPGVEATVAFANVIGAPSGLLWRLACDHRLALALGKKDLTSDYL